jgi:hypothetical protein
MPLPTIAGVVRATFRGSNAAGQQWANVMHFQYAGGASQPGPTEIAALDAKVLRLYTGTAYTTGTPWLTLCTPQIALIDATYYPLTTAGAPTIISHTQAGSGVTNTNIAQEVAHVLTLRTALRGRRNRGRIYLPAVQASNMSGTGGVLIAANLANFLIQARGLLADLASIQWSWGVASYGVGSINGVRNTWAPYFTPLQDVTMDAVPDVQRRRKQ